ncbi:MAG: Methionine--tRNA ligase [Chlamydiia bacterium]|nr:Methionine--tRNA ligase [Chlamydiia bacterium]
MKERVLITSALLYANGTVHFGHLAGAYLPADIYARFKRISGDDVLFVSGSDEYGIAITMSAEKEGRSPKEQVDHYHFENEKLFKKMNISFDHYSRTTNKDHDPIVQEFFLELLNKDLVEETTTKRLYSETDDKFLADRYVMGECPKCGFKEARGDECPKCGGNFEAEDLKNPVSKATKASLVLKETTHFFLRCDLFKERLHEWVSKKDWKPGVINFIKPYIDDLKPRAITRDMKWGVKLPLKGRDDKVLYVWFDAPIGYLTAVKEWGDLRGNKDALKTYFQDPDTKLVQFIGKDNIIFHSVIFPSMLMGQSKEYNLVDDLPANEFLNLEGKQFSKSNNWTIDLSSFLEKYNVDSLRYTLAANAPENSDSEFTWKDFQRRVNGDLVGKFANFVHRTLTFVYNKIDHKVPQPSEYDAEDDTFFDEMNLKIKQIAESFDTYGVRHGCTLIMELAALANAYFDHKKPWALMKNKETISQLNTTMYLSLMAVKALALVSYPVIPETAQKIWAMLNLEGSLENASWSEIKDLQLTPGALLNKPEILFDKIEDEVIEEELKKLSVGV